jgi:hypothetical protein
MKKVTLIAIFASAIQVGYAQMTNDGKGNDCSTQAINDFNACLLSNNITSEMVYDGNSTIYLTAQGNPPPGQIQSCIAHYDQSRTDCPQAPVIVNNSSNNGNQLAKTPH